jgi:2'-5' RNA ligase
VRLFVALEIPSAVRDHLAALIKELGALDPPASGRKVRWVRPANLHVTLKFIGEVPPARLNAIGDALSTVRSEQPAELRFRGLGFFPSERRPRVLWAGVEASPTLVSLAVDVDECLEKPGVERERRPFTPHLTLARFEPPGVSEKLGGGVRENVTRDFGVLRTGEFHLIESKLKPSGAEYTTLQTFRFAAEA